MKSAPVGGSSLESYPLGAAADDVQAFSNCAQAVAVRRLDLCATRCRAGAPNGSCSQVNHCRRRELKT